MEYGELDMLMAECSELMGDNESGAFDFLNEDAFIDFVNYKISEIMYIEI